MIFNLENVQDYYPYGKTLRKFTASQGQERFLTTQHERDEETGLDYRGARFYDAEVGRFLSLDPLVMDYPSLSDYSYVAGNPIIFIDPTGKSVNTDFVDTNSGTLTHIEDGKDQVIAADQCTIEEMQKLHNDDTFEYYAELIKLEESNRNLNMTSSEFMRIVETIYVESSGGYEESLGIFNVLENRAANQGSSLMAQLSARSPYGVYGVRKTGGSNYKYSYRNEKGAEAKRRNINKAVAVGATTSTDVSNGGFFWDGADLNPNHSVTGGYNQRYEPGYLFTNSSHDIHNLGNNKVNGTYKFQSTAAIGKTTFSKYYNQGDKWYKSK